MKTIKKNWGRWLAMVVLSACLFFGGLAIRLRVLEGQWPYIKGIGILMMFLGIITFGTLLAVFVLKYIKAGERITNNKF